MTDELQNARNEINKLDATMAQLFAKRMDIVASIANYKAKRGLSIFDQQREQDILDKNAALVDANIRPYYTQFLEHTMHLSKRYQTHIFEGTRIAYSGVEGAFAWVAARRAYPSAQACSYPSFAQAYNAVVQGDCDVVILPLENSNAGEVGQVIDLLFDGPLYINQTVRVPVAQNLLACEGANTQSIQTVISHPQALAQCVSYIDKHGFNTMQAATTASAAKQISEAGDTTLAAIASAEAAALYNLVVVDHDIHEDPDNTTRFAILSRTPNKDAQERFMLMFTVRHEAGALAQAINIIGSHGFNMNALHSRPMKSLAWKYYFYIEAEGNIYSSEGQKLLDELAQHCDHLKVVGSYKAKSELLEQSAV